MSFDLSKAIFNSVDANRDGRIDRNEFNQWVSGAGAGVGGGSSSYESYNSGSGFGGGYGGSSSYESSASYGSGGFDAGFGGASSYESSASYDAGSAGGAVAYGAASGFGGQAFDSSSAGVYNTQTAVQTYATDAQGLFRDPNPQVIRRPAAGGVQTYTQNIKVRFLQPPPVPPPGPLIIKEVRPPQPPAPPPLRIRQQAPPRPQPPPLVLRERPPQPPAQVASQTVIRRLAALPVPPRSVIIERLPPLPPKPRDIIIERWVPYGAQAKRRTIVQRAAAAKAYPAPRNVIIQYEPVQVRIVRQFQRLGVTQYNPQAYLQQYGAQLLDAAALVQQARSAGVVEDISPPAVSSAVGFSAATYGQDFGGFSSAGSESSGNFGGEFGAGFGGSSSFESSSFSSGSGFGADAGFGGAGYSSSSFESGSFGGSAGGFDAAGAVFRSIDANNDGGIDRNEFNRFFQQGL